MIIIDRFEAEYAVCEVDGEIVNINSSLISKDAKESDCLKETTDGLYEIDVEQTKSRKQKILDLSNDLWE